MRKLIQVIVPVIPMLCGCAGSVVVFGHTIRQGHAAPAVQAASTVDAKLKAVTIAFTSDAKGKIDADPRFNGDALLAAVHDDLRTHDLIDDNVNTPAERTVEITIDEFANRPSSNAVVFGYIMSDAVLSGDVVVRDGAGHTLQSFKINADARLTTPVDAGKAQPLRPLYRRFADLTVSELTGVPLKVDDSNTQMPR
jgi:hypothetical protein